MIIQHQVSAAETLPQHCVGFVIMVAEIKPGKFKTCGFGRLETFVRVNRNFIITLFHVMGGVNVSFHFLTIND